MPCKDEPLSEADCPPQLRRHQQGIKLETPQDDPEQPAKNELGALLLGAAGCTAAPPGAPGAAAPAPALEAALEAA